MTKTPLQKPFRLTLCLHQMQRHKFVYNLVHKVYKYLVFDEVLAKLNQDYATTDSILENDVALNRVYTQFLNH